MGCGIQRRGEEGSALVIALLLMMLLLLLGGALLVTSEAESLISTNDEWSEGAFYAAEAAVQVAIDQLSPDPASNTEVVPLTDIGERFTYRTGGRDDDAPQPPAYVGSMHSSGYNIGAGTGYNTSEYIFDIYRINGTGAGPRNARREIEVQVQYGPVAR